MRYIALQELLKKRRRWGNRKELWKNKNLQEDFRAFFHNKCWYSEVFLSGQDAPIDHFRPKKEIKQFEHYNFNRPLQHYGYYWLINEPSNYRLCCTYANRKTGDGGKGCFFPLADDSDLLTPNGAEEEIPLLLDPCKKEDVRLLSFIGTKVVCASVKEFDQQRVYVSEKIYNLKNATISADRRRVWDNVSRILEAYSTKNVTKEYCIRELSELVSRSSPYSACAIACVNSLATEDIKKCLDLEL